MTGLFLHYRKFLLSEKSYIKRPGKAGRTEANGISYQMLQNLIEQGRVEKIKYGYTDRVPGGWHIAVDNKSARNKFKLDFPIIKPHFIEASRVDIGVSEGNIDGITVKIYDREQVVCDCLRRVNTMDGEVFNTVIQRYISDKEKDAAKLMMYASKLGVEKKARGVVGVWL